MSKLLIRHAEVDPTSLLSGDLDPPLSGRGYRQAESLGVQLRAEGLDLGAVAVSEALRTHDTAKTMGAKRIVTYPVLN
jgi:broad specificity phosphatase PhoE